MTSRDALVLPFTCEACGHVTRRLSGSAPASPHRDGRDRVGNGQGGYHIQKAGGAR